MDPSPSASPLRASRIHPVAGPAPRDPRPATPSVSLRLFLGLLAAALVGAALFLGWSASRRPVAGFGEPPDRPREVGEFQLTDRTGRPVSRSDLKGKICVVNFVFTSCGLTCLEVSRNLARLQSLLAGDADDIRLVSFSVDPRTDTPAVLAKFASQFRADPDRWLFLTGDSAALERLVETSFLPKSPLASDGAMPASFLGLSRIALVDSDGRVRGYFDGLSGKTPTALRQAITRLRAERYHHEK